MCSTNGLGSLFAPQEDLSGMLLPWGVDQPDSRVDRWKPAFESDYDLPWEFLHARGGLYSAGSDLFANIRSLEKWED